LLAKDLPAVTFFRSGLCVQRQAAAARMFWRFFRFNMLAFEVGKRHVQRLVAEPGANRARLIQEITSCLPTYRELAGFVSTLVQDVHFMELFELNGSEAISQDYRQ
jgi:hypothetical protein